MAQVAKSQEPSIEEILASLHRVIAEDDSEKSAQSPADAASVEVKADVAAASKEPEPAMEDSRSPPLESPAAMIGVFSGTAKEARSSAILDLTDPKVPSASRSAEPLIDSSVPTPLVSTDHASDEVPPVTQSSGTKDERAGLMSSATSAAVDSAFSALAQTVLVHNARSLDDLVNAMLRPILKVWLDDNLPEIVERLVRTEIDRVSRGRGI